MTPIEAAAREIVDALNEHEHASYDEAIEIIAAKLKPLVEDAERIKRCLRALHSNQSGYPLEVGMRRRWTKAMGEAECLLTKRKPTRRKRGDQ